MKPGDGFDHAKVYPQVDGEDSMNQSNFESYDVVIVGATPAGVAASVRTARNGLSTLLVTYNPHVGGMLSNGLSMIDTLDTDSRSPILDEFLEQIERHYADTYGEDSMQYDVCINGIDHEPEEIKKRLPDLLGLRFEPHVAREVFEEMVTAESALTVLREFSAESAILSGDTIKGVELQSLSSPETRRVHASVFIDATYEGDLAATAGASYRVGRESRSESDEQYAGRIFSQDGTKICSGSTGTGDDAVQAYNYRLCLSTVPENQTEIEQPDEYDRSEYVPIFEDGYESLLEGDQFLRNPLHSSLLRYSPSEIISMGIEAFLLLRPLPNEKWDLNTGNLTTETDEYPEASWERRREIAETHINHILGLLYFLQNDSIVPDNLQRDMNEFGLAKDEFVDNENLPHQLYIREARRMEGWSTFSEHDVRIEEGSERSPSNPDAIAITDHPIDSYECRPIKHPDGLGDGDIILPEINAPGQIPYSTLLPNGLENILVPVALSATHIAFNTVRFEQTWMQVGEAAGVAASLSVRNSQQPTELDIDELQLTLVASGFALTHFEDVELTFENEWENAFQYLGTKGFFDSYECSPDGVLDNHSAKEWVQIACILGGQSAADNIESAPSSLPDVPAEDITKAEFIELLKDSFGLEAVEIERFTAADALHGDSSITRSEACSIIFELITDQFGFVEIQLL